MLSGYSRARSRNPVMNIQCGQKTLQGGAQGQDGPEQDGFGVKKARLAAENSSAAAGARPPHVPSSSSSSSSDKSSVSKRRNSGKPCKAKDKTKDKTREVKPV